MTNGRTGRRPGDPEHTRQAILAAARRTFAANGFDRATIRAIATEAAVDPALVMHHFGTKRDLFIAAHQLPADPAAVFGQLGELPVEERGAAMARLYLNLFGSPSSTALSLLRSAATEPAAASMLREFVERNVIPLGVAILEEPDDDGELRMTLIASQLLGIAVARTVVEIAAVAEPSVEELVRAVAPAIQSYIDGPIVDGA